jgi:FkbM family methyltransferase
MKKLLRSYLKRYGYFLLKEEFMPRGLYLESDLKRLIDLNKVSLTVDIGAFEGDMTQCFLDLFPNTFVVSVEPFPSSFKKLERFKDSRRVKALNFGASNEAGNLKLKLYNDSQLNSFKLIENDEAHVSEEILVETNTIPKILEETNQWNKSIDFLKLDVEGFEMQCLEGCRPFLEKNEIGMIYVECGFCDDDNRHTSFESIRKMLSNYNFSLYGIYDLYHYRKPSELLFANALFLNENYLIENSLMLTV